MFVCFSFSMRYFHVVSIAIVKKTNKRTYVYSYVRTVFSLMFSGHKMGEKRKVMYAPSI